MFEILNITEEEIKGKTEEEIKAIIENRVKDLCLNSPKDSEKKKKETYNLLMKSGWIATETGATKESEGRTLKINRNEARGYYNTDFYQKNTYSIWYNQDVRREYEKIKYALIAFNMFLKLDKLKSKVETIFKEKTLEKSLTI